MWQDPPEPPKPKKKKTKTQLDDEGNEVVIELSEDESSPQMHLARGVSGRLWAV